ncbi:hypothetical protein FSB84_02940 [Pseudobacter ginsenosidimutans]|uniref:hypothetical protein n=1 Tax=Pseudobacter ginsenosidimutans TaxID=661488 RepID=UPI0011BB0F3F|nr:hypothetical protein [Pseudobacter ginsenosidimutans]QEC40702.1 hypothetical protein FSB84_02940 [Pseudobacter ginsenosidimutans]
MQKYLIIIATLFLLASCNKWFDVKPEDQVTKDELFKTESGFMEALNGVYTACAMKNCMGLNCLPDCRKYWPRIFILNPTTGMGINKPPSTIIPIYVSFL